MSKIISELKGKKCVIKTDEWLLLPDNDEAECTVLDVDDEWIKVLYADEKKIEQMMIIRIDSIESIQLKIE